MGSKYSIQKIIDVVNKSDITWNQKSVDVGDMIVTELIDIKFDFNCYNGFVICLVELHLSQVIVN